MSVVVPNFLNEQEAMQVHQATGWQGETLMAYLARVREVNVKALVQARGEDIYRVQGGVELIDAVLEKFKGARAVAEKLAAGGKRGG